MRYLTNQVLPISLVIIAMVFNSLSSAQSNSTQADQRIIDVYGVTHTNNLQANSPERVAYLNYFLDNSYEIQEIPYNAGEKMPKVSGVSLNSKNLGQITRPSFDVNNFNVLLYNFKRNRTIKTMYRVDNTNKVIVFHSEEEIVKAFNQSN